MAGLLVFIAESYRGCRPLGCPVPCAVMSFTAHDIIRPGPGDCQQEPSLNFAFQTVFMLAEMYPLEKTAEWRL